MEDRIRLNVSCVLHQDTTPTDKFLVVVNRRHGMETLMSKIQAGLSGTTDQITRVLNDNGSILPIDEAIGDMLRDGDEIVAVVGPKQGGLLIKASKQYLEGPKSPKFKCDPLPFEPLQRPLDQKAPQSLTIDDLEPYKLYDSDVNDWVVAKLTPKIREFILARFQAAFVTEPKYVPSIKKFVGAKFYQASGSFISVFMKPRNRRGERDSPIQYNIAKTDIKEFQRLIEKNIDSIQIHIDHLEATKDSLLGLLARGMAETDNVNAMLPYKYETWDQVEGVECTDILVPELAGRNPVLIVDANGLKNRLPFLKSSLKRCIYAHLPGKTSFLMLAVGEKIIPFESDMCIPSVSALRDLDEFVQTLPCADACSTHNILAAFKLALTYTSCDAITFIGGAIGCTDLVANSALLHNLHGYQKGVRRNVDVIAVDADSVGELLLRNIAEKNGGKYTMKRFHGVSAFNVAQTDEIWDGVKARLLTDAWQKLAPNNGQHRLTIGGQIHIVEIMIIEEQQRDEFWKAEWTSAKQLLDGSATGSTAIKAQFQVDSRSAKKIRPKTKREVHSVRIGGGFLYQADSYEVGSLPTPGRNPWEMPPRKINAINRTRRVPSTSSTAAGSSTRTASAPGRAGSRATSSAASRTGSRPPRPGSAASRTKAVVVIPRVLMSTPSPRTPPVSQTAGSDSARKLQLGRRGGPPAGGAPHSRKKSARRNQPSPWDALTPRDPSMPLRSARGNFAANRGTVPEEQQLQRRNSF